MGGLIRDTRSLPYPPAVLAFAATGIIFLLVKRRFRELLFLLWVFGGYYFFLAMFHNMRDRYMFPVLPVLIILAGVGAAYTIEWASRWMGGAVAGVSIQTLGTAVFTVVVFAALFPASTGLIREVNSAYNMGYYRAMHDELAPKVVEGSYMFDRMPHRAFFSGTRRAFVPYDSIERVVEFGRSRGVRYWIVSFDYVPRLRPQFELLLNDPDRFRHMLRNVAVYGTEGRRSILLEILP
jgi:hypothetical protein